MRGIIHRLMRGVMHGIMDDVMECVIHGGAIARDDVGRRAIATNVAIVQPDHAVEIGQEIEVVAGHDLALREFA